MAGNNTASLSLQDFMKDSEGLQIGVYCIDGRTVTAGMGNKYTVGPCVF